MKVEVIFDTTVFISESVNEIGIELGLAVILTAIVCWIFLGSLSSTMNVLFAIPMSLLGTIAVLYFCGFTLNTFTLLGLSLAVGLVVDDAVMVMENIFRHAEMGKDRVTRRGGGDQGDHLRGARGDRRRHRHLHAGRLHERRRRQVLPPVRRDALGRRGHLVHRGHLARPARCAQMLHDDVAREPRPGRPRWPTGASTGLSRGYGRALAVVAPRTRGSCWPGPWRCSRSPGSRRRGSRRSSSPRRTRAASACASPPPSGRTSPRPTGSSGAPSSSSSSRPEVIDVISNVNPNSAHLRSRWWPRASASSRRASSRR